MYIDYNIKTNTLTICGNTQDQEEAEKEIKEIIEKERNILRVISVKHKNIRYIYFCIYLF